MNQVATVSASADVQQSEVGTLKELERRVLFT